VLNHNLFDQSNESLSLFKDRKYANNSYLKISGSISYALTYLYRSYRTFYLLNPKIRRKLTSHFWARYINIINMGKLEQTNDICW